MTETEDWFDFEESNGAVCVKCERIYTLAEVRHWQERAELDQEPEVAPCGHSWGFVFDCVIEEDPSSSLLKGDTE